MTVPHSLREVTAKLDSKMPDSESTWIFQLEKGRGFGSMPPPSDFGSTETEGGEIAMNYKIIGGDQKEYGPVTAEQLRQWLAEGRVTAQTLVQPEGQTGWQTLGSCRELLPWSWEPAGTAPLSAPLPTKIAMAQVQGPAIALLVSGGLGAFGVAVRMLLEALGMSLSSFRPVHMGEAEKFVKALSGGMGLVQGVLYLLLSGLIIYGALKMKKLENYGLAMAVSVIAMIPCISPCCCVGLPFGIWAVVVLCKPEVKAAFH